MQNAVWDLISEKQWMTTILEMATAHGWELRYHTYDSRRSSRGFPDLVLVRPPRILFVEVKKERGKLTRDQEVWMKALEMCPMVESYVWKPSDGDEAERVLSYYCQVLQER
jgi:hypothetical protein